MAGSLSRAFAIPKSPYAELVSILTGAGIIWRAPARHCGPRRTIPGAGTISGLLEPCRRGVSRLREVFDCRLPDQQVGEIERSTLRDGPADWPFGRRGQRPPAGSCHEGGIDQSRGAAAL